MGIDIDSFFCINKNTISLKDFYNEEYFKDKIFSNFVFRGQGDINYKLVPTIFRNTNKIKSLWGYVEELEGDFALRELLNLSRFYNLCNRQGLKLPNVPNCFITRIGSNINLRKIYEDEKNSEWWIPDSLKELASLAQHYGMPTRLLDWTYQFNIALYFAVMDSTLNTKKDFSVWCLNKNLIEDFKEFLIQYKEKTRYIKEIPLIPLSFIQPKYNGNQNITMQKGILSLWEVNLRQAFIQDLKINKEPINILLKKFILDNEELFEEFLDEHKEYNNDYILLNFNFKYEERYKILRFLRVHGIMHSTIYPGFKGVVDELEESLQLDIEAAKLGLYNGIQYR